MQTATLNLLNEEPRLLDEARSFFPGSGPSTITVRRYCVHGLKGIKLESCKIGGRRCTSRKAVERFLIATNAAAPNGAHAGNSGNSSTRQLTAAPTAWKPAGLNRRGA